MGNSDSKDDKEKYIMKDKKYLGHGGQANVYLVKTNTGEEVAMKQYHYPYSGMTTAEKKALDNEIKAMQTINHPLIVKYLDFFIKEDIVHVVTEYA